MFSPFAEFAPAKVNLALHVLGRRDDGYHELDSIVAFADVGDDLTFTPSDHFALTSSGPFAAALPAGEDNIIAKAWAKLRELHSDIPPAAIHLTKNLPVASGIGGGSANAAAAIRGFMKIAGLASLDEKLRAAALALGADVPVCLAGRACRMRGVGEKIEALEDFAPLQALLVNPGVGVSTAEVFQRLGLVRNSVYGSPIAGRSSWRNDLASAAIALAQEIGDVLDWLKALPGAEHVAMSGSGATCFAVGEFGELPAHPAKWWTAPVTLR